MLTSQDVVSIYETLKTLIPQPNRHLGSSWIREAPEGAMEMDTEMEIWIHATDDASNRELYGAKYKVSLSWHTSPCERWDIVDDPLSARVVLEVPVWLSKKIPLPEARTRELPELGIMAIVVEHLEPDAIIRFMTTAARELMA